MRSGAICLLFSGAVGPDCILMDDIVRPVTLNLVVEYKKSENIRPMDWPVRSPDLIVITHSWDALGRVISTSKTPPSKARKQSR
ncbi:hypothetical protein TNCV_2707551 [Trichonephila clavipes]|nr:hypothetical protein TNCV_2707551 [Trichonephila clavipes]